MNRSDRPAALRRQQPKPTFDPKACALTPEQALARASSAPGPFEEIFFSHQGRPANKWVHYLPFYDRALAPYRGRPVRMLEIGVMHGGSLELWRKFFGPEATIFGIDVDPACAGRADPPNQVRIGSQADPEFLRATIREMGGLDIVLDDGSHMAAHQRTSFEVLWPLLAPGGLYMIEDMHTAYFPTWDGGLRRPGTAVEMVKSLVDDLHGRYYPDDEAWAPHEEVATVFAADSIAAIEKAARYLPAGHVWAGSRPTEPNRP